MRRPFIVVIAITVIALAIGGTTARAQSDVRPPDNLSRQANAALAWDIDEPRQALTPETYKIWQTVRSEVPSTLTPGQLDSFIVSVMQNRHVRGAAACVVLGGEIVWTGAYGYRTLSGAAPVSESTLFILASISKTFTATAAMQLWENGALGLDGDVNNYVPFTVTNYKFPGVPITMRMLLSHTSSIERRDNVWYNSPYTIHGADSPIPLDTCLRNYLTMGGFDFIIDNYLSYAPGTYRRYCNHAFGLAGSIVEKISVQSLDQYCQDSIFGPLGMSETSWFLENLDTSHIAMPMGFSGGYYEFGHEGIAIYPSTQLRTSVLQLGRYLGAYLSGGSLEGQRILESATIDTMWRDHYYPSVPLDEFWYGLGWDLGAAWGPEQDTAQLAYHTGSLNGAGNMMYANVTENTGFIFLSNSRYDNDFIVPIAWELFYFSRDRDHDGIADGLDACPGDAGNDPDLDGVCAAIDNCSNVGNPEQTDADHDGIGDACCCLTTVGNVDCDPIDGVDVGDLTTLIDNLFITFTPLCCPNEGNCDIDVAGNIDVGDLTALIDNLFITFTPLGVCQ